MADVIDIRVKTFVLSLFADAEGQTLNGAILGTKLQNGGFKISRLVGRLVDEGFIQTDGTGPGNHVYTLATSTSSVSAVHRLGKASFRKNLRDDKKADDSAATAPDISSVLVKGLQAQLDQQKAMIDALVQRIAALEAPIAPSTGGASVDA